MGVLMGFLFAGKGKEWAIWGLQAQASWQGRRPGDFRST